MFDDRGEDTVTSRLPSLQPEWQNRKVYMSLLKKLSAMKVKEVPNYLRSTITLSNAKESFSSWMVNYKTKYIDTGSSQPLKDVLFYGLIFSYVVSWPAQYAHQKAAEEAARAGGHH